MIAMEDKTIHITRGDATSEFNRLAFYFPYYDKETETEKNYKFKPTDKISFVVFEKKGYTKSEILRKEYTLADIGYTEPVETIEIPLTVEDTKKFPLTNKAQTYWYEVILNETTTILGYDDDGAKKVIIYPKTEEME